MAVSTPDKVIYYLYKFNTYSDRIIKRYNTLQEYLTNSATYDSQSAANFCEKDGVFRPNYTYRRASTLTGTPNYAIVVDGSNNILSRWFVYDAVNTNSNTFTLTLKRDSVADYYDDVITAPTYIEKATLSPNNPLIFNNEDITLNKIKTSEKLLKDKSNMAWVVGYLAPDTVAENISTNQSVEISGSTENAAAFKTFLQNIGIYNFTFTSDSDLVSAGFNQNAISFDRKATYNKVTIIMHRSNYDGVAHLGYHPYAVGTFKWDTTYYDVEVEDWKSFGTLDEAKSYSGVDYAAFEMPDSLLGWVTLIPRVADRLYNIVSGITPALATYSAFPLQYQYIGNYFNKVYKVGDEYYKLEAYQVGPWDNNVYPVFGSNQTNYSFVSDLVNLSYWKSVNSYGSGSIKYGYRSARTELKIIKVSANELNIQLTGGERVAGTVPYKIFAIPYSRTNNITIRYGTSSSYTTITMTQDLAIAVAKAISSKYSGIGALYDLQLLPFCPDQTIIVGDHTILLPTSTTITTLVKRDDTNIGAIYWCADNRGSFDITNNIAIENVKVESICDMYRLSSPNWNGVFEFNAAKNGGVTKFNVDYTYKPHTPYIHINPDFGRLYGTDYDDARGLICSGDFSLPQTSSAWNTYELQNKNYQNQFQRQIENMETMHRYDMTELGIKGITGIVSGAASGAQAGGGSIIGTIIGGITGAAASAAGSALDQMLASSRYNETIDYKKDTFKMSLENIKAIPSNLTNVGAMTYNNKLFPVLEYYTCTDVEREALINKLYYNGMTVGIIDQIANYLQDDISYIKGKIIRLNINEDNHIVEDIKEELDKGVFIK